MPLPLMSALGHPNSGHVQEGGDHPRVPLLKSTTPLMGTQ